MNEMFLGAGSYGLTCTVQTASSGPVWTHTMVFSVTMPHRKNDPSPVKGDS